MKFTPVLSPDVAVLILIFPPRRVVLGVPANKSAVLEIAELVNKEVSLLSLKNLTLKSLIKSSFSMFILKEISFTVGLRDKLPINEVVPSDIPKFEAEDKFLVS